MILNIRPAHPSDARLIFEITRQAFAEYKGKLPVPTSGEQETFEKVQEDLAKGGAIMAVLDGEVVGAARYQPYPDYLYIGRVAVLPSHRGLGIATAMLGHLEVLALKLGKIETRLGTRGSLPHNIRLYQGLGYTIYLTEPHPRGPDEIVHFSKRLV